MKHIFIFLLICLSSHIKLFSQKHKPDHYSIAFTTLHTDFPFGSFSSLFTKEFHPGFEVGTGFTWKTNGKHAWFQDFQFGYSYQRFVQHSIVLYSEFGYRHQFLKTFSGEATIGAGYLQAISAVKIFKLQSNGSYKKKNTIGRPQAMASFSVEINKRISTDRKSLFIKYQQRLQFPFIKSYVPLLPTNMLMFGIKVPIKSK